MLSNFVSPTKVHLGVKVSLAAIYLQGSLGGGMYILNKTKFPATSAMIPEQLQKRKRNIFNIKNKGADAQSLLSVVWSLCSVVHMDGCIIFPLLFTITNS